jgi:hypothetical protein
MMPFKINILCNSPSDISLIPAIKLATKGWERVELRVEFHNTACLLLAINVSFQPRHIMSAAENTVKGVVRLTCPS